MNGITSINGLAKSQTPRYLQIKAYQQLPYTNTETVDLFNRSPVREAMSEQ